MTMIMPWRVITTRKRRARTGSIVILLDVKEQIEEDQIYRRCKEAFRINAGHINETPSGAR